MLSGFMCQIMGFKGIVSQLPPTLAIRLKPPIIPGEEVDNPLVERTLQKNPYFRFLLFLKHSRTKFMKKKGHITDILLNCNLTYYKRWPDSHLTSDRASS